MVGVDWTRDFMVVDTETTGPDPQRDRVVQVGWCRFTDGQVADSGQESCDPGVKWDRGQWLVVGFDGVNVKIPEGAFLVHGLATGDVVNCAKFPEVWGRVRAKSPGCLVSYNGAYFDWPIITRELAFVGQGNESLRDQGHIDLYILVNWWLRGLRSRKMGNVCHRLGIKPPDGARLHTAQVDCEVAGRLALYLADRGLVPRDLEEARGLMRLLARALNYESQVYGAYWFYEDRVTGALRMGCGRYTGLLMTEVPQKELTKILTKWTDVPDDVREILKRYQK